MKIRLKSCLSCFNRFLRHQMQTASGHICTKCEWISKMCLFVSNTHLSVLLAWVSLNQSQPYGSSKINHGYIYFIHRKTTTWALNRINACIVKQNSHIDWLMVIKQVVSCMPSYWLAAMSYLGSVRSAIRRSLVVKKTDNFKVLCSTVCLNCMIYGDHNDQFSSTVFDH